MGQDSRTSGLEQVEHVFQESSGGLLVPRDARDRAYRRADAALNGDGGGSPAATVALLGFAADMFAALAVELAARPAELRRLIDKLEDVAGIPRAALGSDALRNPQLLQLPTAVAIEVQLALVLAYTGAEAVSLWTLWSGGSLKHIGHAGEFDAEARETRELARKLLSGRGGSMPGGRKVAGVIVERWQQPAAALVARGDDTSSPDCAVLLEAAVPMLTATLERDELLGRGSRSEQEVVAATERRLTRLRFDLHDGPQQDLMLLADDLRLLRSQLGSVMEGHGMRDRMVGRLDDLQARLVALDGDLRRISSSLASPFLQREALPDALAQLTDAFSSRTGIEPEVSLRGDLTKLTDSQQITLLGLIRESLSNVREHSDANHVTVSISANSKGVEATVTDDGRGFEPEATLVRAARDGHLGLVGMHERVRLLGGRTEIDSRPGGPTVISANLPAMPAVAPRPG